MGIEWLENPWKCHIFRHMTGCFTQRESGQLICSWQGYCDRSWPLLTAPETRLKLQPYNYCSIYIGSDCVMVWTAHYKVRHNGSRNTYGRSRSKFETLDVKVEPGAGKPASRLPRRGPSHPQLVGSGRTCSRSPPPLLKRSYPRRVFKAYWSVQGGLEVAPLPRS